MHNSVEQAAWESRYAARAERMRASEIRELLKVLERPGIELSVDVASRSVILPGGTRVQFPLDAFAQTCLLEGVDQLGYLLKQQPAIQRYEELRHAR